MQPSIAVLLLLFQCFFLLLVYLCLAFNRILAFGQSHFRLVQFGTSFIGLICKFLFFLDSLCGCIYPSGFKYVLGLPFGTVKLPLEVLLEGLGLRFGNHLVNNADQSTTQKKANNKRTEH